MLTGDCRLPATAVLAVTQALELAAGRRRRQRNAARLLDIDLLLYGSTHLQRPELTLPHPRLQQRLFALLPLAELLPDHPLAPDGVTVEAALQGQLQATPEPQDLPQRVPWPERPCFR